MLYEVITPKFFFGFFLSCTFRHGNPSAFAIGIIDGLEADLTLAPLRDECSCREDIHPFDTSVEVEVGDFLRYRPLGCPVTHFAKVIDKTPGSIFTVHMVGPLP